MKLTVLTPLYNRRQYAEDLFRSLAAQTVKDFQWLVIDDGSDENSKELFAEFAERADFPVEYYYKENGGKHTALNFSHPYIKGEWVLILDSDDTLTPDAVETVIKYTEKYGSNEKIGIISFQRGTDENHPLVKFPETETVCDHITFRINENRPGDCCEVIRADILREYPFPVFENEKFLVETHLWVNTAEKYLTAYIPNVIYLNEYRKGGLTDSGHKMRRTCPLGGMYSQKICLSDKFNLKFRLKRGILLDYYGKLAGKKAGEILRYSGHPVFCGLLYPAAVLLYHYENQKNG